MSCFILPLESREMVTKKPKGPGAQGIPAIIHEDVCFSCKSKLHKKIEKLNCKKLLRIFFTIDFTDRKGIVEKHLGWLVQQLADQPNFFFYNSLSATIHL